MTDIDKPIAALTLDGVTLETIVTRLSETLGWEAMAAAVPIRCFSHDPSIKSSLKFLRRTPWARTRVEQLYLQQARDGWKRG
ncbi:MAG: DUF2132 domain-containing protein [Sulfuricella sp.]|nr:DUF2132 domain-containing protein [Sulfuricella sp.]